MEVKGKFWNNWIISRSVDSRYLTNIKDDIFKISSNEVKSYFYNGFLKSWLKKFIRSRFEKK